MNKKHEIEFKGISMSPLLKEGDKLLVDIKSDKFTLGDIIVIMDKEHELLCHRVIQTSPLQTKGDRNLYIDQAKSIVGVVTHIKKKSNLISLNTNLLWKSIQAYLCRMNNHKNEFRKIPLLILFIMNLWSLRNEKRSVENHTQELE